MLENEKKSLQDVSPKSIEEVQEQTTIGTPTADFLNEIQQENARSAEKTPWNSHAELW